MKYSNIGFCSHVRFTNIIKLGKYDHTETFNGINEHYEFMKENLPVDVKKLSKYHDSGFMYCLNRDKAFRPVLIIDMGKLINGMFV